MRRDTTNGATVGSVVVVHAPAAGDRSLAPAITADAAETAETTDAANAARHRAGMWFGDGKSGERWRVQLVVGLLAVAAVLIEGAHVAHRPVAGALDRWLQDVVPGSHATAYLEVTKLRYPWVVVVVAVLLAAVSLRRDWPRAVACLVGPPLAVFVGEELIKPLVGRTLGGALSYPSGSTTGAAALATAAILAVPPRWKRVTVILGVGYALWMALAVVALRWHFPTDSLAGAVLGIGVVLVVDSVIHLVAGRIAGGRILGRGSGRHRRVDASLT
jgi:membrane-associated phospholipid phosphatase